VSNQFGFLANGQAGSNFGSSNGNCSGAGCSTSCVTGRVTHHPLCGAAPNPYPNGTILLLVEPGHNDAGDLPEYYEQQIQQRGYRVLRTSSYDIGRGEWSYTPEELADVTGFMTLGHSCSSNVAGINRTRLNELLDDIALAKGSTSAELTVMAFWGCKTYSFYENGANQFRTHLGSGAAVYGYGTSAAVNAFKNGFGAMPATDPFLNHLEEPTPGEYEVTDILGGLMNLFGR
jgi:hypothetical protein